MPCVPGSSSWYESDLKSQKPMDHRKVLHGLMKSLPLNNCGHCLYANSEVI